MVWDWLIASIDATRSHEITAVQAWHGRFMTLAWGVCAPLGILIARYLKVMPGQNWPDELDNRFWWHAHLVFQIGAGLAMAVGFAIILRSRNGMPPDQLHAWFGWIVLLAAGAQIASGFLRGTKGGPSEPAPDGSLYGDHYSMTKRRLVFEAFHKALGYLLLIVGAGVLLQGMWQANAPRWMFLGLFSLWGALIFAAITLSKRAPNITTYQAIWGPDPSLPGNKRRGHAAE